ncbi:MAG TPA: TIGR02281 family clan AA aspartic protease [Croceibacterium sp.]
MRATPLLVIVAAGGLFGWFAPDLAQPAPAGAESPAASAPEPAARPAEAERERWHRADVTLERAGNGHFYAEVSIDSGSALMLVDTGATVVALTGQDASMMGVDWRESDVRPVARGASGDVYGVPVMLENVQVGDLEARRVKAIVVPEGLEVSLLGQSFLSQMKRVEMTGDEMVLGD